MTRRAPDPLICQLKVTLEESDPPIWRRILVPATISLGKLHDVLQIAMGWTDSHLHQFVAGGMDYAPPGAQMEDTENENRARLSSLLERPRAKLGYEYDMGDSWSHEIVLEKSLPH